MYVFFGNSCYEQIFFIMPIYWLVCQQNYKKTIELISRKLGW